MSERLVRIEYVAFGPGEGPSGAYAVVDEATGDSLGLGLFKTRELAREAANVRGLTILIEAAR